MSAVNGDKKIHLVVLGAGFGGLMFCKHLRHPNARITVVDRTNHHLFQPLLYQVAACGLSAPDIAQPIRGILTNRRDITVLFSGCRQAIRRRVGIGLGACERVRMLAVRLNVLADLRV